MPDDFRTSDPTSLTTQQLYREIAALRDQLVREDTNNFLLVKTRLDAMDKAIVLLEKYPTDVDQAVKTLKELHGEKFAGITDKFGERDIRFKIVEENAKERVSDALKAAKELVSEQTKCAEVAATKSELAMGKQMDSMKLLFDNTNGANSEKIEALNTRLTTIESHSKGSISMWGYLVGAVGLIATLLAIAMFFMRFKQP